MNFCLPLQALAPPAAWDTIAETMSSSNIQLPHKFQKQLGHCLSMKTQPSDMKICQTLILVPIKHPQPTSGSNWAVLSFDGHLLLILRLRAATNFKVIRKVSSPLLPVWEGLEERTVVLFLYGSGSLGGAFLSL